MRVVENTALTVFIIVIIFAVMVIKAVTVIAMFAVVFWLVYGIVSDCRQDENVS